MIKSLFFIRSINARKNWYDIFNVLKEKKKNKTTCQPENLHMAKLFLK